MCFSPAGGSLINRELLRYLTDSEGEKGGKTGGGKTAGLSAGGCSDKEPYVLYLGTNGLAGGLKGRFMGRAFPP